MNVTSYGKKPKISITSSGAFPIQYRSEIEFAFVLKGSVTVQIDEQSFTLNGGDGLLAGPYVLHGYSLPADGSAELFRLTAVPEAMGSLGNMLLMYRPKNPAIPSYKISEAFPQTDSVLYRWYQGLYADAELSEYLQLFGEIMAFLSKMIEISGLEKKELESESTYMKAIQICYHSFCDENFNAGVLSSSINVSTAHIQRIFMQNMGMGLHKYIMLLRMDKAESLLRETTHSITSIAMSCGFSSVSTFNHAFVRHHGCSPCAYRKSFNNHTLGKRRS